MYINEYSYVCFDMYICICICTYKRSIDTWITNSFVKHGTTYIYIHTYTCIFIHMSVNVHIYTYIYSRIYIICICVYICIYTRVHMYT